jgi:(p)ppGpp synthase/HD superfamily hydrolase
MEFQIRTNDMNNLAQSGIAAHWVYKSKTSISKLSREQQWLNNLLDIQKQAGDPRELLGSIKEDLNPWEGLCFLIKGANYRIA